MKLIKSGIWSIETPNRCARCHAELLDDKAVLCEKCRLSQIDLEVENGNEKQANREIEEVVQKASLDIEVIQTSGVTYYTTSGGILQNISGVVYETGKSVRGIHYIMKKSGLPKRYEPLNHHALVFTDEDIERIKKYTKSPGYLIIDGNNFVSTSHLSDVIHVSRQSINKHARDGDWITVLIDRERWNQVQGVEDYLVSKQRQRDAVELRRNTVRSCSGQNVPRVELPSPDQPLLLSNELRSNAATSEDANPLYHKP